MIHKINKRTLFHFSLFVSSIATFFGVTHRGDLINITSGILDTPIIGIEKANAQDGCGGCSGSACDTGVIFPTVQAADFVFDAAEQ